MNTCLATDAVFQSYGRCCASERFFEDFYQCFIRRSDAVRTLFANTDMAEVRQTTGATMARCVDAGHRHHQGGILTRNPERGG
ncbi:hypothetical protein [Alcanivorax hongdengensis]|uniref:hypothetical protein n=1 Tax=Alcanivorax hongdengensis TaxID=519051 RepID=UPI00192B438C|nr:hypothetical protein [Alcanivorax hongdengensis]